MNALGWAVVVLTVTNVVGLVLMAMAVRASRRWRALAKTREGQR